MEEVFRNKAVEQKSKCWVKKKEEEKKRETKLRGNRIFGGCFMFSPCLNVFLGEQPWKAAEKVCVMEDEKKKEQ